jgi:DNA-binding beta-propeller fold protein YncE
LTLVLAEACGGAATNARAPAAVPTGPLGPACARAHSGRPAVIPLAPPRTGSTVALALRDGKTLAYAADEDEWAVHVVDVDTGKTIETTPLASRPSELMFLPDGRLVVLLRDKSQVQVMEPDATLGHLEARCAVDASSEPVGLALTPDDAVLLVTSGWGRALTAFDAHTLSKKFEVALAREPRSVVVSDDGKFAYVSHAVGAQASKIDLADTAVHEISLRGGEAVQFEQVADLRKQLETLEQAKDPDAEDVRAEILKNSQPSCQGYALAKSTEPGGRIFAPQVLVNTGEPGQQASGYGDDDVTEAADVAVIDSRSGVPLAASLERVDDSRGSSGADGSDTSPGECLLPRAAAFEPTHKSLLVSCLGTDEVIEYDAVAASPARAERRRWSVASGPNGIAIDPVKNRAVVWSQFERTLDVLELGKGELLDDQGRSPAEAARLQLPSNPARALGMQAAVGRMLFHAVGDGRISKDGRACASCHPDGRDDSLVWATPNGPRRSIMLAGRLEATAPYSWSGDHQDLKAHLATTFDRLHGAGGLRGYELDALVAYIQSLTPPPTRAAPADSKVEHGAKLFSSPEVGCSGCHSGTTRTDNEHHDVQSRGDSDDTARFNTPSLRFVGGTGPYFHDGRYKTLRDLLTAKDLRMGKTRQLSAEDLEALEAYLRTL